MHVFDCVFICVSRSNRRLEFNDQVKYTCILNCIPCINKESKGSAISSVRKERLRNVCILLIFSSK